MSSFHDRQKSLFNTLKDAEDQYSFSKTNKASKEQDYGTIDRRTYRRLKNEMKQFRGKESIFKRSEAKISDCLKAKRVPDHVRNPQKYAYYSLADVTPEQMSDATNLATARAFISEMEQRHSQQNQMDEESDFVFKKPTFRVSSTVKVKNNTDDKPIFKNGKLVMPEYVVGLPRKLQKKDKPIRNLSQDGDVKTVALKLNHLYEEEEEE